MELVQRLIGDAKTKCSALLEERHDAAVAAARDVADTDMERNAAKEQYNILEKKHDALKTEYAKLSRRYDELASRYQARGY